MDKSPLVSTKLNGTSGNMFMEISVAVNYLLSHLYTKLPRRRVDNFGEELEKGLFSKWQPHWFSEGVTQDVSHRCLRTSGPQADFLLAEAAVASGLDWTEIQACLPSGLAISIDPGYVVCQFGPANAEFPPSISSGNSAWNGNAFNSTSLSSSGCSSASSISSNASSGSWQKAKFQVLYTASSRSTVPIPQNGEKEPETTPIESKRNGEDSETHLATEAALSVLTEPEEVSNGQCLAGSGFDFNQGMFDTKAQNSVEQNYSGPNKKQSADCMKLFTSTNDCLKALNIDQSKIGGQNQSVRCLDGGSNAIRNSAVNLFASTDATGDGAFFEAFAVADGKSSIVEVDQSFIGFPMKQTRALLNSNSIVDAAGENEFQPFEYQQMSQLQNLSATQNFIQKSTSTPSFTAATFAQTKFGSTKLKSQTKRPHRLVSPSDNPNNNYPPQLIEVLNQPQTPGNPLTERVVCLNELRRNNAFGAPSFVYEANRNYFLNYPNQMERNTDVGHGCGFPSYPDGVPFGHNNSTPCHQMNIRSCAVQSGNLCSQFEKIRTEFQIKNSQFPDITTSESMLSNLRSNATTMSGAYSSSFHESAATNLINKALSSSSANRKEPKTMFAEGFAFTTCGNQATAYQTDIVDGFTNFKSQQPPTGKFNGSLIDECINSDLQDLWNSQKLGGFCWPHDKPSPGLDGLNISER